MAHIAILPILLLLLTLGNSINAGIRRQLDQMLPNNERITRSVHYPIEDDAKYLDTIPVEDDNTKHSHLDRPVRSANDYDLSTAENNIVFKPLFRKKFNRRVLRSTLENDLQPAENNVVFKPLFRRRPNKRIARSAPNNADDMQTAENGIVFRPLFRRRQNLQNLRRFRRDVQDDMQTAENNVVFRPLFRKKPIRRTRSADNDLEIAQSQYAAYYGTEEQKSDDLFPATQEEQINTESDDECDEDAAVVEADDLGAMGGSSRVRRAATQNGGELMETAANSIVFRPLFRNNRRNFNRQRNFH